MDAAGDVGLGQEERSVLTDTTAMDADEHSGPIQQLLGVLGRVHELAQSVSDGGAGELWSDECMNQLILGVELGIGQGWGEVVDAFTDAGRILQSYENSGRADEAAPFLTESYELLCAMMTDSMNESMRPEVQEQWRAHYQREVDHLEEVGVALVRDEDGESEPSASAGEDDPFEFPDISQTSLGQLKSTDDDLPTLDELPPLENMLSGDSTEVADDDGGASEAEAPDSDVQELVEAFSVAESESADASDPKADEAGSGEAEAGTDAMDAVAFVNETAQPSRTVVEFVDRICEELAGLSQRDEDERMLALEMIQGGIAALKREAVKDSYSTSAEICDEMMKASLFAGQTSGPIDERFADLGFGFCGVYVEAMSNPTSENVSEWRSECGALLEEWAESAADAAEAPAEGSDTEGEEPASAEARAEAPASGRAEDAPGQQSPPNPPESLTQEPDDTPGQQHETAEALEQLADAAEESPEPESTPEEAVTEQTPSPDTPIAPGAPAAMPAVASAGSGDSQDLFAQAQEALLRGDGEAAKALALQAAAMIAESEVEKAEQRLRDAEARLKANINATEEARSEVKHSEKLVMHAASDVAAGETLLGKAKSQTAKMAHEVEEAQEEVAELERQIAELQAKLKEQMQEVEAAQQRLDEAREQEGANEGQIEQLREGEKEARKNLEAARQRVKDSQRVTSEIESEMEQAREDLSRQRTSLADINQTIHRPEPIKTDEGEDADSMLF